MNFSLTITYWLPESNLSKSRLKESIISNNHSIKNKPDATPVYSLYCILLQGTEF